MPNKFAFLIHPRNTISSDMAQLFGAPLKIIPDRIWEKALSTLLAPPIVTGKIINRYGDHDPIGYLITIPLTPNQLLSLPRSQVQGKIGQAIDKAKNLGCDLVGLGALTAPASVGGKAFEKRFDIGITNGNAFTAVMTLSGLEAIISTFSTPPVIAFVGATGSVGSCLVKLYAKKHSGHIILLGRNAGRLEKLAADIAKSNIRAEISTEMSDIRKADVVVLLTSASEAILNETHLKNNAIVLDDTVPRNTDSSLQLSRPDVKIIDGGLVEIPGINIRGEIGLKKGLAYACLAETILLSLENHQGHFSIGSPDVDKAEYILSLAEKHKELGFHLAPFRSFGKPINLLEKDVVECAA